MGGGEGLLLTVCLKAYFNWRWKERSVPSIERILHKLQGALQPTPSVNSGID